MSSRLIPARVQTPRPSQKDARRPSSRSYFLMRSEERFSTFLSAIKTSTAARMFLTPDVSGTTVLPVSWSSMFCLTYSASGQDRVFAGRHWRDSPVAVQRSHFLQSHRLANSSPAYLQPFECRTKIVMVGVVVTASCSLISPTKHRKHVLTQK